MNTIVLVGGPLDGASVPDPGTDPIVVFYGLCFCRPIGRAMYVRAPNESTRYVCPDDESEIGGESAE